MTVDTARTVARGSRFVIRCLLLMVVVGVFGWSFPLTAGVILILWTFTILENQERRLNSLEDSRERSRANAVSQHPH